MISSERRRALLEQLSESASYCRVFENIWIGDIGSAAGAASGAITTFRGVLNASGKESKGISFAPEYEARKIAYETLFDPETGMTLADSKGSRILFFSS